jgi:hypothetical protein
MSHRGNPSCCHSNSPFPRLPAGSVLRRLHAAALFFSEAATGIGPSIAGGLAGGLAAGAGIVAREQTAHHLLDSGEREVSSPLVIEIAQRHERDLLGGADFGISDASSWDDEEHASGGDDWN